MTEEIWKPVVNFDGYYEVSNKGRVRSVPRIDSNSHAVKGTVADDIFRRTYERCD